MIKAILNSFKALKNYAIFDEEIEKETDIQTLSENKKERNQTVNIQKPPIGLNLGYVINLNLPATTDVAVFDAIFESLKKHILE